MSSGQPVNKPLDAERFRKAYLKSLQQEIYNNEKNLKGNLLYAKTGEPQQPMDTRTVEERLQDKEALKPQLRSQLMELMDGGQAEKVVQNANTSQLTAMIDSMPFLISQLKPKYQMGMFADAFLAYLDKYVASESRDTIDSDAMMLKTDIQPLIDTVRELSKVSPNLKTALLASFKELERLLLSSEELDSFVSEQDALLRKFNLDRIDEAYLDIPTKGDFYAELDDIVNREENGDVRGFNNGLKRLGQILDGAIDSAQVIPGLMVTAEVVSEYVPTGDLARKTRPELQVYARRVWRRAGDAIRAPSPANSTKRVIIEALVEADPIVRQLFGEPPPDAEGSGIRRRVGRGLPRKPARATELKNSDIDWKSGVVIPKVPKWLPLGKYIIHRDKLNDNILSIKTPSGQGLADFKMIRVNEKIGGALRTIISGGQLTYDQIGELDDNEKNYLFKLGSKSGLSDRINVPAPDKKKDDQDINKFEIMKGQIMAGNDNEQLIKEFKKMIVKLREKELLPKRQATDMLLELAKEGY